MPVLRVREMLLVVCSAGALAPLRRDRRTPDTHTLLTAQRVTDKGEEDAEEDAKDLEQAPHDDEMRLLKQAERKLWPIVLMSW